MPETGYVPTGCLRVQVGEYGGRPVRTEESVLVEVRCPPAAARECRGRLRVLDSAKRRIGEARFAVAPGRRAAVIVPLGRRAGGS